MTDGRNAEDEEFDTLRGRCWWGRDVRVLAAPRGGARNGRPDASRKPVVHRCTAGGDNHDNLPK